MKNPKPQESAKPHTMEHPPHGPSWKRMHHTPFFWFAAFFIMLAMAIYIMTDGLAIWPGKKAQAPVPALAP